MTTEQKTCSQRINSELQQRNEYLEELIEKMESDDREESDEAMSIYQDMVLNIEEYKTINVHFSTGGPADWVEVRVAEDGYIMSMYYHFADWYDHASIKLDRNSYLADYVEQQIKL